MDSQEVGTNESYLKEIGLKEKTYTRLKQIEETVAKSDANKLHAEALLENIEFSNRSKEFELFREQITKQTRGYVDNGLYH